MSPKGGDEGYRGFRKNMKLSFGIVEGFQFLGRKDTGDKVAVGRFEDDDIVMVVSVMSGV